MPPSKNEFDSKKQAEILAGVRRTQTDREKSYREQALKLFPHVCGRCCREFSGPGLRELTVHHRDNDHMNNPPNGSNWELLCIYCHDAEHQDSRYEAGQGGTNTVYSDEESDSGFNPFAGLKDLLGSEDNESDSG